MANKYKAAKAAVVVLQAFVDETAKDIRTEEAMAKLT